MKRLVVEQGTSQQVSQSFIVQGTSQQVSQSVLQQGTGQQVSQPSGGVSGTVISLLTVQTPLQL